MDKSQSQVHAFHKAFDFPTSPAEPKLRTPELRANLIAEEAIETIIALVGAGRAQTVVIGQLTEALQTATRKGETEPSLERAIDGLCDLKYVTDGTAEDIGIDLEPFSDEVHRSNMSKVGGTKRADGKWTKPDTYSPANIAGVLATVTVWNAFMTRATRTDMRMKCLTCNELVDQNNASYCDRCRLAQF